MWAAFKALIQQEGTCAPSTRCREGDSRCEIVESQSKAQPIFDADRSDQNKSSKKGSKSREHSDDMFWNENEPNPNMPLPHLKSPAAPSNEDERAPRIEAKAWRIRAAEPKALSVWEVRRLLVYEPGEETSANDSICHLTCSGSACDDEWGQLEGWEVKNAFRGPHTGHGWGGRPDKNWEIWLGAEWGTPLQVERVKILQGEKTGHSFRPRSRGPTIAQSVFVEAKLKDGSWGLVAGPVPLNADGWTTIRLCCAGAKRRRANSSEAVPTPSLRVASPNEALSEIYHNGHGIPPCQSVVQKKRSSKKKVTFAKSGDPQAFPSLGL